MVLFLPVLLCVLAVCAIGSVCVAAVLAILIAISSIFVLLGILYTAIMWGWMRNSVGDGLRALFIQIASATGLSCGMFVGFIDGTFIHPTQNLWLYVAFGGTWGLVSGVVLTILFNRMWTQCFRWFRMRYISVRREEFTGSYVESRMATGLDR